MNEQREDKTTTVEDFIAV